MSGLYNMSKADFDTTLDLTKIKPYGDTMNDGKMQLSFTLPIKDDERGEEAARQLCKLMGLEDVNVAYHHALDTASVHIHPDRISLYVQTQGCQNVHPSAAHLYLSCALQKYTPGSRHLPDFLPVS